MTDQISGVSEERVIIPNKYGEKLVGILHSTGSKHVVVLCHGFRSSKEDTTMLNLVAALTKQGISAFNFDFSGNGESEGDFQFGDYKKEVDDLHSVTQYLFNANRTCTIVGHSKGGNVVLLYASTYHDVNIVINVSGRFALEKGIEERLGKDFLQKIKKGEIEFRVTEESLMERLNTNMAKEVQSIDSKCSVCTIHGSADEVIPVEDAYEFAKLIPNHKLHIIEGANHCYTEHQEELASAVLDFLKSHQVGDYASAAGV